MIADNCQDDRVSSCGFVGRTLALVALLLACDAMAAQIDIPGPPGSGRFGSSVSVLPNGNIVVVDPYGPVSNVGAVYVYTPAGVLLSTLTGSSANDNVGIGGIKVLANGNFVVLSPGWRNGTVTSAGAVTWVNGVSGLSGVVSLGNSLVGTMSSDRVGSSGVTALSNGNYVVVSTNWHNVSAVTWGNGSSGVTGAVSSANSLVGAVSHDYLGTTILDLGNGNFIIASPHWNGETGAVTWVNGAAGISGSVSAANSLVGAQASSHVGENILGLSNGNYVVLSPSWHASAGTNAPGAATWANGSTGLIGVVSAANSLTGIHASDQVGTFGVALTNGNYVVVSPHWQNGISADAGAATWANGSTGLAGITVSAANSLVGTSLSDSVGNMIVALSNGNYVVGSPAWSNGASAGVGAVTWGNGNSGVSGPVSPANSLIGSVANDLVGVGGLAALSNGNYVVSSPYWHNGAIANAGAATWASGTVALSATISAANSLIGAATGDSVSGGGVVALGNGNYVVSSPQWNNGPATAVGAATWGNGASGIKGFITANNSLTGSLSADQIGNGGIIALSNGHYVVGSKFWDSALAGNIGAATWANGAHGRTGFVSLSNSIVGTAPSDNIGANLIALSDGNWAMRSTVWDNGATADAGAVTLASGGFATRGTIAAWNSVVGTVATQGAALSYAYDAPRKRLAVGKPAENIVSLFTMDQMFGDGFE